MLQHNSIIGTVRATYSTVIRKIWYNERSGNFLEVFCVFSGTGSVVIDDG